MKGLILRIFLWVWVALVAMSVSFTLVAIASFPPERAERRTFRIADTIALHAGRAAARLEAGDRAGAETILAQVARDQDTDLTVVRDGLQVLTAGASAAPNATADILTAARAASAADKPVRSEGAELDFVAMRLDVPGWVGVASLKRFDPFRPLLDPETLLVRLAIVLALSGVVALALASYLTRPLRVLRAASARLAGGDLGVRVGPGVGRAPAEIRALGRDFDTMAERVASLLESQRQLLRDVSHELRSPLARMGVALELCKQRSGPEALPNLQRIERDAERLAQLVSEILTLARLEAGDAAESAAPVDLAALVGAVASDTDFEAQAHRKSVIVRETTSATVFGRAESLRSAIENVVRNAIRFTAEGTAVELELERVPDPSGSPVAEIRVRDHGPGVPEAALADIFRPFHRVEPDRDRQTGGAGIGLAIAQRAVQLHGGTVRAENVAAGSGLRVVMRLPIRPPVSGELQSDSRQSAAKA